MLAYLTMSASQVARNLDHCLNSIDYFTRVRACWDSGQFIATAKYLTLLARQHWQHLAATLQDFQFNSWYSKATNHQIEEACALPTNYFTEVNDSQRQFIALAHHQLPSLVKTVAAKVAAAAVSTIQFQFIAANYSIIILDCSSSYHRVVKPAFNQLTGYHRSYLFADWFGNRAVVIATLTHQHHLCLSNVVSVLITITFAMVIAVATTFAFLAFIKAIPKDFACLARVIKHFVLYFDPYPSHFNFLLLVLASTCLHLLIMVLQQSFRQLEDRRLQLDRAQASAFFLFSLLVSLIIYHQDFKWYCLPTELHLNSSLPTNPTEKQSPAQHALDYLIYLAFPVYYFDFSQC